MKRTRATDLVAALLTRVVSHPPWPLVLVDQIHVFGSFARGALEPHDIDIAVEFTADAPYTERCVDDLVYGRAPHVLLRRALAEGSPGFQFQFQQLDALRQDGIATTLLWRRGECVHTALGRLAAIAPDPHAGRAVRDHMLAAFEGIDRQVPLPVRHLLSDWSAANAVTLTQVELPDRPVRDLKARRIITRRWSATSPLLRAATNAVAYLEEQWVCARAVHLHAKDIDESDTPHFVGFQWRY